MKNTSPVIKEKTPAVNREPKNARKSDSNDTSFESRDIFNIIAKNTSYMILHFRVKPSGGLAYVSPSSSRITGYAPEEFYADPGLAMRCVHPDDQQLFMDFLKKNTTNGHEPFVLRWIHKNGRTIWTEQTKTLIRNEHGELTDVYFICRDVTDGKLAEEALRESQKFVSSLLENAPHATVVINPDTSIKYVNPAWEKVNGWTLAEVVGMKAPYPWWPEEYKDTFSEGFKEAMKQGSGKGEVIAQKKNGELYWIDMNWASVTHNGEFLYLLINSIDITERKQAEEKQQAIIKTALDGFWICSLDGKFLEVNDSYCKITGYTREELLKMSIQDVEAVENPEQTAQHIRKIVEQGSDRFETQHKCKDGRIIDIEISVSCPNAGEGQMYVFVRDITERKRAEEALRISEEKYRSIFESANDIILLIDDKGKILDANSKMNDITGFKREDIVGRNVLSLTEILNERSLAKVTEAFKNRMLGSSVPPYEIELIKRNGEIAQFEVNARTLQKDSKIIGDLALLHDVTERNHMEQALRESEEKFSVAFRSSPDMVIISNLEDGKYIEVNDSFIKTTGYTRDELIGHSVNEFNLWVKQEELDRMNRLLGEQGKIRNEEYDFRMKSGEIRTWLCQADIISIGGKQCMLAVAADITERKKAREALRESEEKFSKAFHASPISISISQLADGKFIEVNESFLRDKGYTRQEVIGHSSTELNIWMNPGTRDKIIQRLKERGRVHNELSQFRTKSGHIRTGLLSAELISIGNEPYMITMNNDITQQKQAEERLSLLSSVTQQVSDSTIVTDRNFKITYMNQAAQDLFGYSTKEALGKGLDLFNAEPVPEKIIQNIFQTVASGKVWSATVPKRRKDGNIITCECRVSPLYDEKGHVYAFIDVQRDVTEQKKVEEKLQEQKKLIESILATMPEGVLVLDKDDRIILANEAFYKIFHRSKKSTVNKLLGEIIHLDQLYNLYQAVKSKKHEPNTLEFRYRVKDIDKIIYSVVIKMDGERTLLTFSDISKEREEEEKLYLTDRLASIGEMAAGLAHELNNPLTGIMALSQLLVNSDVPEEHKEDLQSIHEEAKRAASIVKNVLLFARNTTFENGQASVNEVVKDVLRLREYEEKVSNIKVVTNLEDDLPNIPVDKYQLQQVFLNIILNAEAAIKEANRPGVLKIKTERSNSHVNIMFTDNGCGIKKHIMPRIFDPFFTTKDIGKGTGLGLSICYSIVVKHGGKISVKSQVNEGSTFTIKMPIST
jgi:nitrogen fixation negative regulator NifL